MSATSTSSRHLRAVAGEPAPVSHSQAALSATKSLLISVEDTLRAARASLNTVPVEDPVHACAATALGQVEELRIEIATALEHLDNRGVA